MRFMVAMSRFLRLHWQFIFVLLLAALVFGWIQSIPTFGDADPYHHIRMAKRIASGGDMTMFPALPRNTVATRFADQHLLFHIFLIPFILTFGAFTGMKVATATLGTIMIGGFFLLARRIFSRHALLVTLILLTTFPFLFRMNLGKASALELIILFGLLAALIAGRRRLVPPLLFIAALAHGSWPVTFAILLIWALVFGWKKERRVVVWSGVAVLAAFIIHPSFPNTFLFFWDQTIRIALFSLFGSSGGAEWGQFRSISLLSQAPLLLVIVITLITLFIVGLKRQTVSRQTFVFLFSGALLSFMTMMSRRHIEFSAPLLLLGWLSMMRDVWPDGTLRSALRRPIVRAIIPLLVGAIMVTSIFMTASEFQRSTPVDVYRRVSDWTRENIPVGALIVASTWDTFPALVYGDDTHTYLTGLDPRFYRFARPEEHAAWKAMVDEGEVVPSHALRDPLRAEFLMIFPKQKDVRNRAARDDGLELLYEDDEAAVFGLISP